MADKLEEGNGISEVLLCGSNMILPLDFFLITNFSLAGRSYQRSNSCDSPKILRIIALKS